MQMSEKIDLLAQALVAAQAELKPAPKDSENPFFKSTYADLTTCIATATPVLVKHGLAVSQMVDGEGGVTTILLHKSGQWISGTGRFAPTKNDPQGYASAVTYGRRYGYSAIIGLTTEDDDGNAASRPAKTHDLAEVNRLLDEANEGMIHAENADELKLIFERFKQLHKNGAIPDEKWDILNTQLRNKKAELTKEAKQ